MAKWLAYLAGVLAGRWMVQQMTTRPPEPEPGVPDEEPIEDADPGDEVEIVGFFDPDFVAEDEPPEVPRAVLLAEQQRQFMRIPTPDRGVNILNGCPRCNGPCILRRSDRARYCRACDRAFFPEPEAA